MINLVFVKSGVLKGINNDLKILENVLKDVGLKTRNISTNYENIKYHANRKRNFPLSGKVYVFSEILLPELFAYLLSKNKKIVIIPNIDSYSSYRKDHTFLYYMKKFSKMKRKFYVLSKTHQVQRWLNKHNIKNYYFNFCYYKRNYIIQKNITIKNNILLDTGGSLGTRKYCNQIIKILKDNKNFNLIVKTLPSVYKLHKMEQFKNVKIITKMMNEEELDKFYQNFNFSIYLAKYDGYGLSLGKAIASNHFIFCNDGLPWNELLENYPRKCLIKCSKIGIVKSQNKYKTDFDDLKKKLKDYQKYVDILNSTIEKTGQFNINKINSFKKDINKLFRFI